MAESDGSRLDTDLGGDQSGRFNWDVVFGKGRHRKPGNAITDPTVVPRDPGHHGAPHREPPSKINTTHSTNPRDYDYLNDI